MKTLITGTISRKYLELMKKAGHQVLWEVKSIEDADKHSVDPFEWDVVKKDYTVVCLQMYGNIEDVYTPEQLVSDLPYEELPLLIGDTNVRLRNAVESALKNRPALELKPQEKENGYFKLNHKRKG